MVNFIKLLFSENRKFCADLKNIIGYVPSSFELYKTAFIHRSAPVILLNGSSVNNERLEYLGDAVLDTIIADFLFNKYPTRNEGFLSQMRSKIVKRKNLNDLALKLGIDSFCNKHLPNANCGKNFYGDALEALIGAIYIDKNYFGARKFVINKIVTKYININELEQTETDFKSRMIEWAQKNHKEIRFDSQEEYDVDENIPQFVCMVMVFNDLFGLGKGASKKEAEQNAAEQAFIKVFENI